MSPATPPAIYAGPWTCRSVEGEVTRRTAPFGARRYDVRSDGLLHATWGAADGAPTRAELCARGDAPPPADVCPSAFQPARTVEAAPPEWPFGVVSGRATVVVRVALDASGAVTRATVLRSDNPLLDPPAIAAVRASRFAPAYRDCRPIASTAAYVVTYANRR